MSTTMRAWDAFTGVAYDLPAMTRIQSAMAWALQVEVGTYKHYAHSLHYYLSNEEAIAKMDLGLDTLLQPPWLQDHLEELDDDFLVSQRRTETRRDKDTPATRWAYILDYAAAALDGADDLTTPFQWYSDLLAPLDRNQYFCQKCRYYTPEPEMLCHADFS